jgi:hypothetical protein
MCIYTEFREKQEVEISNFPICWAFNEDQLKEAMLKLNVTDRKELATIGAGSVLLKNKVNDWYKLQFKQSEDLNKQLKESDDFAYCLFSYELRNHEFVYTNDLDDFLESIGLNSEKIKNNERLFNIFLKAKKEYLNKMDY